MCRKIVHVWKNKSSCDVEIKIKKINKWAESKTVDFNFISLSNDNTVTAALIYAWNYKALFQNTQKIFKLNLFEYIKRLVPVQ